MSEIYDRKETLKRIKDRSPDDRKRKKNRRDSSESSDSSSSNSSENDEKSKKTQRKRNKKYDKSNGKGENRRRNKQGEEHKKSDELETMERRMEDESDEEFRRKNESDEETRTTNKKDKRCKQRRNSVEEETKDHDEKVKKDKTDQASKTCDELERNSRREKKCNDEDKLDEAHKKASGDGKPNDGKDRKSKHRSKSSRDDSKKGNKDRGSYRRDDYRRHDRYDYNDYDRAQDNPPRYYDDYPDKSTSESDRYWSKYPNKNKKEHVGSRYYGDEDKAPQKNPEGTEKVDKPPVKQRKVTDMLTSKTGGAYIPPAKLRMMQAEITDKTSAAYQRIAWEALKKSIHGFINKVNVSNIRLITKELLRENIVRGRGLLCKSLIQAQAASPTFTHVYAALVSIINSKFPNIGELLLRRLVLQFKRGFKRNDKIICISAVAFVAHLVNQRVAHEILSLEILTLLVESPTDDSVEVAISFLKECGQKLTEVSPKGINAIFEMLRNILHEGQLEQRIQYMIEVMFQVRKDGFKDHVAVIEDLDIVPEEEQFTHLIMLDEVKDSEDIINVFKFDEEYEQNEGKYQTLCKEILGSDSSSGDESGDEDDDDEDEEQAEEKTTTEIIDNTETNLVQIRLTIYLTIHSSLDFEECAHKLMKMQLKPGQEIELCHMFVDCCAEERTYEKFYGLLAQRFCQINKIYVTPFEQIFKDTFSTAHRLKTNKLRNVSKFFAHLLFTDAIGWEVLDIMKLNKDDTTSSSRIFIKILFQELCEFMGLAKLNNRLKDPTLQGSFSGLFPRDNPKSTRFAINFFTSIGLGGLTDELREHIKNLPKTSTMMENKSSDDDSSSSTESSSSSDESSSSSSSSASSSSSDSSSSHSDENKKRMNKIKTKKRYDERKGDLKMMNQAENKSKHQIEKSRSKEQSSKNKKNKDMEFEKPRDRSRQEYKRRQSRKESSSEDETTKQDKFGKNVKRSSKESVKRDRSQDNFMRNRSKDRSNRERNKHHDRQRSRERNRRGSPKSTKKS